jgi:hypothetical protein
MPRKKLFLEKGKKLLEDTKRRLRREQEARTRERIEQLEFERFERLGRRLYNETFALSLYFSLSASMKLPLPVFSNTLPALFFSS